MTQRLTRTAELALGLYLGDQIAPRLPNGRLRGKMETLSRRTLAELTKYAPYTRAETELCRVMVNQWADRVGWDGKPRAIVTLLNLMLALYDRKPWAGRIGPGGFAWGCRQSLKTENGWRIPETSRIG